MQSLMYVISAARARRERCLLCEAGHHGAVTPSLEARVRAYEATHPGHRFVVGVVSGTVAVISGTELVAWDSDLPRLLDTVGAPPAGELS